MSNSKKITTLLLLLVFVFALLGALFSYRYNLDVDMSKFIEPSLVNEIKEITESSDYGYIEIYADKVMPSNKVIVSDRFTGTIKEGAQVILVGESGSLYTIADGVLLIENTIVTSKDETYTIQQANEPQKLIVTN